MTLSAVWMKFKKKHLRKKDKRVKIKKLNGLNTMMNPTKECFISKKRDMHMAVSSLIVLRMQMSPKY